MSQLNVQRINLGTLNNPADIQRLVTHLTDLYKKAIPVITGSGAPTSIPPKLSAQYLDTTGNQVYIATGTTKTTHWVKVS